MLWLCLLSSLLFLPVPWFFLRGLALGWVWQSQGMLPGVTACILLHFGGASSPAQHPSSLPTGIEKFKGHYLHSRNYKDPQDYKDKRVIVIGIGNSGSDLAVEISQTAKQVSSSSGVPAGRASPCLVAPSPGGTPEAWDHHLHEDTHFGGSLVSPRPPQP